ncbi:hypothetical protein [Xanthovirga aplysinae]|uniref:hypothetical protein n=1 Tax=Xanthovirga aplysinae TaxID=2529853 RepID=UPI0012BD4BDF|nr:hypothetical protein [Xanthovirga aplysinae]MTI30300.1 hypothetical protein [Xanthovirga aplysinae]
MQKKLNWEAFSGEDRNNILREIQNVISINDGCILNFNMFSDLALSLCVEIEEKKILGLHKALKSLLKISDLDLGIINQNSQKEWLLFINLSFSKGTGDLKMKVPEVPG